MTLKFPAFNPFPAQATTAVAEGPFLETYRSWAKVTPTAMLEPVKRMCSLTRRFQNASQLTGRRAEGQAVYVHGEHGSGKTHAIRAGIGIIATDTDSKSLLPLYVKLSEPDFLHAYRLLMSQVSLSELTEIVLRFLGSLTRRGPLPLSVGEQVQRDPSILLELFDAHLVERGIILQEQAEKLQPVVEGEANFQRALTYLLEPDLKDAAYRWLLAKQVPEQDLRRLGISGPLQSFDECRYGLQLLTLLCTQAGRHLIIVLDQAEKFLIDQANTALPQSVGLLHRLVDAIPDIGGMLVVASNDETWSLLPADLRQRFGSNDVPCTAMQPKHLLSFLGIYIRAALDREERMDYVEAWPFNDSAAQKLLRNSGGNLRRLLQLAWRAFDDTPTDADVIDADAIPNELLELDRATVEMSVRRILWKLGPLQFAPRAGFDFALGLPNQGRMLIRLSEALFYSDEAERAEEDVLARLRLQGHDLRDERCALIVIGYVSEGVRHLLDQAYDHILVYRDPESMANELGRLVSNRAGQPPGGELDLTGLYPRLAELGWSRTQHANELELEAANLVQSYHTASILNRFDDLVSRWPQFRDNYVRRVQDARRQRAHAELLELDQIEQARQHRQRQWLFAQVFAGFVAALISMAFFAASSVENLLGGLGVGTAVTVVLVLFTSTVRSNAAPQRPDSLLEAREMARVRYYRYDSSPWRGFDRAIRIVASLGLWRRTQDYRVPPPLRTDNLYRRYGYVLTHGDLLTRHDLRHALRFEQVAMIRRALADRLGRVLADEAAGFNILPSDIEAPELPYIVQHCRVAHWTEIAALSAETRLLIAIACHEYGGVREGGPAQRPGREESMLLGVQPRLPERRSSSEQDPVVLRILQTYAGEGALGAAYGAGLVHKTMVEAFAEVKDHELRRIQDLLSPIDGLGALDHLQLAPELERLYLFFEQLRFFRDGGALV